MNLRTLKCWAVYDPKKGGLVHAFTIRGAAEAFCRFRNDGCVVVTMKGRYVRRKAAKSKAK